MAAGEGLMVRRGAGRRSPGSLDHRVSGGAGRAAGGRRVGYKCGMRTVAAITFVLALAPLAFPQGFFLRLPLLDQAGLPLSYRPVPVWVQGPVGTEVLRGVPGPEGVLEEAVRVSPVSAVVVSAAGYLPAQVTELHTLEIREGETVRVYLVPPEPVRLRAARGPGIPWGPGQLIWAHFRGPPSPVPARRRPGSMWSSPTGFPLNWSRTGRGGGPCCPRQGCRSSAPWTLSGPGCGLGRRVRPSSITNRGTSTWPRYIGGC